VVEACVLLLTLTTAASTVTGAEIFGTDETAAGLTGIFRSFPLNNALIQRFQSFG
jgi:hypothetical protein